MRQFTTIQCHLGVSIILMSPLCIYYHATQTDDCSFMLTVMKFDASLKTISLCRSECHNVYSINLDILATFNVSKKKTNNRLHVLFPAMYTHLPLCTPVQLLISINILSANHIAAT